MTYYNLSFIDNSTGLLQLWVGVNDNSGGTFIAVFLITLSLLMLMVFTGAGYNIKDVMLGVSFIMGLIAGFCWGAGLIAFWVVYLFAGIFFISLFVKIITGD